MYKLLLALLLCVVSESAHAQYAPTYGNQAQIIGVLKGANFNVTTDQAIKINYSQYKITDIFVTNCSTSLTTAAGGFYTVASKGGTIIGSTLTTFTGCTSATTQADNNALTNMNGSIFTASNIYLSLTTAQGAAATGDVYIVGVPFN